MNNGWTLDKSSFPCPPAIWVFALDVSHVNVSHVKSRKHHISTSYIYIILQMIVDKNLTITVVKLHFAGTVLEDQIMISIDQFSNSLPKDQTLEHQNIK